MNPSDQPLTSLLVSMSTWWRSSKTLACPAAAAAPPASRSGASRAATSSGRGAAGRARGFGGGMRLKPTAREKVAAGGVSSWGCCLGA
jgi:hypothetical protein